MTDHSFVPATPPTNSSAPARRRPTFTRRLVAGISAGALALGLLVGGLVLFADADQSTPIEQFDRLAARVAEGFDVVVGSRAIAGAAVSNKSLGRRILSGGLHVLVSRVFGIQVADTQCGFKLFTAPAAQRLFSTQVVDGFSFDLEVLYLAHKLGYRVAEEPVDWYDAPGSTVDAMKVTLQFLRDLVRIRFLDLRGAYREQRRRPTPLTPTEVDGRTPR